MNEIYEVIGASWGSFRDQQTGKEILYASLFAKAPFKEASEGSNYHTIGEKCFVFKCLSMDVLKDVRPGDMAELFFNEYKKVSYIRPV